MGWFKDLWELSHTPDEPDEEGPAAKPAAVETIENEPPTDPVPSPRTDPPNPHDRLESFVPLSAVEIFVPYRFDDCQFIADALKRGAAAIVNFYYLLESDAVHMHDFLAGCIYVLGGDEEKITKDICVYTPRHTELQNNTKPRGVLLTDTLRFPWER